MRGHDQTGGRVRSRARRVLAVVAWASMAGLAAAQDPEVLELIRRSADPIDLAATRLHVWDGPDGARWVALEGDASVLQVAEGVRADRALVRIVSASTGRTTAHRLDVYAEGRVRPTDAPGRTRERWRATLTTEAGVNLRPETADGLIRLDRPPVPARFPLLARGFPDVPAAPTVAASAPPMASEPPAPAAPESPATEAPALTRLGPPPPVAVATPPLPRVFPFNRPPSDPSRPPAGAPAPTAAAEGAPAGDPGPAPPAASEPPPSAPESPAPTPGPEPHEEAPPAPAPEVSESEEGPTAEEATDAAESPADVAGSMPSPVFLDGTGAASEPAEGPIVTLGDPVALDADPAAPAPAALDPDVARASAEIPAPESPPSPPESADPALGRAQFLDEGFANEAPLGLPPLAEPESGPEAEAPPGGMGEPPEGFGPMDDFQPLPDLEPLPEEEARPLPARPGAGPAPARPAAPPPVVVPIQPGTQRVVSIFSRDGGPDFDWQMQRAPDGTEIITIRGGVRIVADSVQNYGTVDLSADNAVIWRKTDPNKGRSTVGPNGAIVDHADQPMEVYLEGNVLFRQDQRKVAGDGDWKVYRARQAYFDFVSQRFLGNDADLEMFVPGLIAPIRTKAPQISQYRPLLGNDERGRPKFGMAEIRADHNLTTGSRFPTPGYRFTSRRTDITQIVSDQVDQATGAKAGKPKDPNAPKDLTWRIDARSNAFFLGAVPIFYWPRMVFDADDPTPPIRAIQFRTNNYFGQQVYSDWNAFKLLNLTKPAYIDAWNVDWDYLSYRGVAGGTEVGWFGKQLIPDYTGPYYGYFDIWGLRDHGIDDLGGGPAVITGGLEKVPVRRNGTTVPFGRSGLDRLKTIVVRPGDWRGRATLRHMQSLLADPDEADPYEDFRVQAEVGYLSDRDFLEQYYKFLFDSGMDQETLTYLIRQRQNHAWSLWVEGNLNNWYTETQWLPRADYYRLGDAPFGRLFTYYHHTGVDWANTHTAAEVANPNVFQFIPYDPVSLTSRDLSTGRLYTAHELDLPIHVSNILRVVPYVQGQWVGWNSQYADFLPIGFNPANPASLIRGPDTQGISRFWGAAGVRASVMAWRAFPDVHSDLLYLDGLAHKIYLTADYRDAYSNYQVGHIGIQDDLDDNTYEFARRYFAMYSYTNGVLPAQYNPVLLTLRRAASPITFTTDVQQSIETLQLGLHQRLQTKRGPEGRRRVTDWMILDLTSTYYPYARRDNFGVPWGQTQYNWEWYIGDRTSLLSYGWFEFWNVDGKPKPFFTNNPDGLRVIIAGVAMNRPPRANFYAGYSIVQTGVIKTSALNASYSYWLSPKWYSSFTGVYDFGYSKLLGVSATLTRVGADYLTSLGLTFDPQRQSATFGFELSPRLSPNLRLGSASGFSRFDSRFAPTE